MNKQIRWRIISLQAMLVVILAAASGFLFYEGNFVTSMVHDQLVAQKISFPGTDQIKAGGALDPAKFSAEIRNYAGQAVDNGDKARVYANDFINVHLQSVANGQTYSQVSTLAQADPTNTTLAGEVATLFKGETLRSMLLNAYGWGMLGTYTTYAGIGLLVAALVVLGALVFELFIAGRKPETLKVTQKIAA
ncbi:MAG TPA: hypothetical protein VND96_00185 [Candidatus Micrarchaeaceae archaeon]|nr:hypothetical protein [Candidatus Micrarchaeaceae archaeon]